MTEILLHFSEGEHLLKPSVFKGVFLTGIDHRDPLILIHPAEIPTIIAVDMAVNHIAWLIFPQQGIKDSEASVDRIFLVMKSTDGRVGQQDIKALVIQERKSQAEKTP